MQKRSLGSLALWMLCTLGLYQVYWLVKTKDELNAMGAKIPTAWLLIIPFVNFYFFYRYSQAFTKYVNRDNPPLAYFALLMVLPWIATFIFQDYINKRAAKK